MRLAGRACGLGGMDDGDADAMATGRLDPDLYMHIYLFNISFVCVARLCGRVCTTSSVLSQSKKWISAFKWT